MTEKNKKGLKREDSLDDPWTKKKRNSCANAFKGIRSRRELGLVFWQ